MLVTFLDGSDFDIVDDDGILHVCLDDRQTRDLLIAGGYSRGEAEQIIADAIFYSASRPLDVTCNGGQFFVNDRPYSAKAAYRMMRARGFLPTEAAWALRISRLIDEINTLSQSGALATTLLTCALKRKPNESVPTHN